MSGMSWKAISNDLHIPKTTLFDRRKEIEDAVTKRSEKVGVSSPSKL